MRSRFWFWFCVLSMGFDIWGQNYVYAGVMLCCALFWGTGKPPRRGGPRVRT